MATYPRPLLTQETPPEYSQFVPEQQLYELTGYRHKKQQERVLRSMGLVPFPGRNGSPKVTWEAVNRIMAGEHAKGRRPTEPDFGAMNGA